MGRVDRLVTRNAVSSSVGVLLLNNEAFVEEVRTLEDPILDEETPFKLDDPLGVFFLVIGGIGDFKRLFLDVAGSDASACGIGLFLADAVTTSLAFELP